MAFGRSKNSANSAPRALPQPKDFERIGEPSLEGENPYAPVVAEADVPAGIEPEGEMGGTKVSKRRRTRGSGKGAVSEAAKEEEGTPTTLEPVVEIPADNDKTPKEVKASLAVAIEQMQSVSESTLAAATPLSQKWSEYHNAEKVSAASMREARAEKIAAESGLTEVRAAMLSAEAKYREAFKQKKLGKSPIDFDTVNSEYQNATLAWSNSLAAIAAEKLFVSIDRSENAKNARLYYEALVIRKRDTILRKGQVEVAAQAEALDERGKTAYGKVLNWAAATPKVLLAVYNAPFNAVAEVAVAGVQAFDKRVSRTGKSRIQQLSPIQKKAMVQRYARGAKILAGAAVGTAIATAGVPVTAAAGLTFVLLAGRGVLGMAGGVVGGNVAGTVYEKFFGSKERATARQAVRQTGENTLLTLQRQQKAAQMGSRESRLKKRQWWQMGGALLGGGAAGLASAPLAHVANGMFTDLPSVKDAEEVMRSVAPKVETTSLKPDVPMAPRLTDNTVAPNPNGVAEALVAPKPISVTIEPGQGADQLFAKFQQNLDAHKLPPEMHDMLSKNPNELSRTFGLAWGDSNNGSQSWKMQPGDTLEYDSATNTLKLVQGDKTYVLVKPNEAGGFETTALTHSEPAVTTVPEKVRVEAVTETVETTELAGKAPELDAAVVGDTSQAPIEPAVPVNDYSGYSNLVDGPPKVQTEVVAPPAQGPFGTAGIQPDDYVRLDELGKTINPSVESLTLNPFGVDVDPKVPAVYEWKMPGTENKLIVASGGTPAEAEAFAKDYVSKHPDTTVLFKTPPSNSLFGSGRVRIDAWSSDAQGKVEHLKEAYGPKAATMLTFSPENFTRELASK